MTKPYPTIPEILKRIGYVLDPGATLLTEEMVKSACDLDREHREVAEVSGVDLAWSERKMWQRYPWATCAAKDENGQVRLHEKPATCRVFFWSSPGKQQIVRALKIPSPWQDSLRARPEGV